MKSVILTLILFCSVAISAQTDIETLEQLNQKIVTAYQAQKYGEADKLAQRALEISLKINGAQSPATAAAYTNLALVRRERKKYGDAVENLQKAIAVYQKTPDFKERNFIAVYEALALSQYLAGRNKEAEETYLKTLELTTEKFGVESKEVFASHLAVANFYAGHGNFDRADEIYMKAYALAVKKSGKDGTDVEQIDDNRACFVSANTPFEKKAERERQFAETKKRMFGIEQGNVLIGELARPDIPRNLSMPLNEKIVLRVRIDEKGKVLETQGVCGLPSLVKATADAARRSSFNPVTINGAPAPAKGYIVYGLRTELRMIAVPGVAGRP